MIKRKFVISSSLDMSRRFSETVKGVGSSAVSFNQLVLYLYNHPVFLIENKQIVDCDFYIKDIKLYESIKEGNYFYGSRDFLGSRKLILNALNEVKLSCDSVESLELPVKEKGDSFKEIYNAYFDSSFDYAAAVKEVISRIEKGLYNEIFKNVEIVLLDKSHLIGFENKLYELLVEKIAVDFIYSEVNLDFHNTTCKSSITKRGNINHFFKWMKDNSLNTANTVLVALDYDETAKEFYSIKDTFPVYFTKGLKCNALSFFEPFITELFGIKSLTKEDSDFFLKSEKLLRGYLKKTSGIDKIFYQKVLSKVKMAQSAFEAYVETDLKIDVFGNLISEIEGITFSQEELGLTRQGLHLTTLDDVYALELENVAVVGLQHCNYPRKVKLDPILKEDERILINKSTQGCINTVDSINTDMLEKLLTKVRGCTFLSYVSHCEGSLTVPSVFFNHILAANNKEINVEEIYKLCGVKDGYIEDFLDQQEFLDIKSVDNHHEKIQTFNKLLYSNKVIEHDYGYFETMKTRLSATSLTSFFNCPFQFNLQYNHGLYFPDLGISDLSAWLDSQTRGSFIHKIYEEFINGFIKDGGKKYQAYLTGFDDRKIRSFFDTTAQAFISENELDNEVADHIKKTELEELFDNFKMYIQKEIEYLDDFYPIKAESMFESEWDVDGELIVFKGFIDRIDTNGKGDYRIWDFKTGNNPFEFDKGYLFRIDKKYGPKINLQHALYLKALKDNPEFDDVKSIEAGYYYTSDNGGWARVTYEGVDPITKQKDILRMYIAECQTKKYYKNPKSCKFCDYKSICSNNQHKRAGVLEEKIDSLQAVLGEDYV